MTKENKTVAVKKITDDQFRAQRLRRGVYGQRQEGVNMIRTKIPGGKLTSEQLLAEFGSSYGHWLHESAHGRDDRPVVTHSEPVSISRETTFERDMHAVRDKAALSRVFTDLCERVATDLQRKGVLSRTIGIKLRFDDFKTVTRDLTLDTVEAFLQTVAGQKAVRPIDGMVYEIGRCGEAAKQHNWHPPGPSRPPRTPPSSPPCTSPGARRARA